MIDHRVDSPRPISGAADIIDVEWVDPVLGLAGLYRLEVRPAVGATWLLVAIQPSPGVLPVVLLDHELPLASAGFEFRASGVWTELVCEAPFDHWTVGLEAFALELDAATKPVTPNSVGDRVPLGLDLDLEMTDSVQRDGDAGFRAGAAVRGEVLVGAAAFEIDAVGVYRRRWDGARPTLASVRPEAVAVGEIAVVWPDHPEERRAWFVDPAPGWGLLGPQ